MILTESNFNRIKNEENYKLNFSEYKNVEDFNKYITDTLENKNTIIVINNMIRIINIINKIDENNSELEIKELILKANLSENKANFKEVLRFLDNSSDDRILRINRIIDEKLLNHLDEKLDLLIKLEAVCKYFYPDYEDQLIMNEFKEMTQEKNNVIENEQESKIIDDSNRSDNEFREESQFKKFLKRKIF